MSSNLCTVCGSPLQNGVCPRGHPQRAARALQRKKGAPVAAVIVALVVIGLVYAGLFWWPVQAAGDLMQPASEDFAGSVADLRATVAAFPSDQKLEGSEEVIKTAPAARDELSGAQLRLEDRRILSIPIVSGRPAFALAQDIKEKMLEFYVLGLETVADLEAVARYLTEVEPLLPALGNLRKAVGAPKSGEEVEDAVAAAQPIAEQLRADLKALEPPDEVSAVHTSLLAIVEGIQEDLAEIDRVGGGQGSPVLKALFESIREQLQSFDRTAAGAPGQALKGTLGDSLTRLNNRARTITEDLVELREKGVDELTIPEEPTVIGPL